MHRPLLVAHLVVTKVRVGQQRLPHPGHTAVAKNTEGTRKKGRFHPVVLDHLMFEKPDQGLRHGQAHRGERCHGPKLLLQTAIFTGSRALR